VSDWNEELKKLREKAKRERKFLVMLKVDGRHLADDSMTVTAAVTLEVAKKVRDLGLEILNHRKARR
jgi:hypothetical protein